MDGETGPVAPGGLIGGYWPPISQQIWDMKYRLKTLQGEPVDRTVADTWRRVARALAVPEQEDQRDVWEAQFFDALKDFRFMPGGRVLAGAGTGRDVTLFNCFVMGTVPDDMGGIFAHLREAALTMQQGGGIGYDFSTLRPQGAPVLGVGADASGPLSFMDCWDSMCRTIMSAGSRRGAMMATLRCDHPDIEAFIDAKREPGRLRMFNLSVLVTDPFMAAVAADSEWPLVFGDRVFRTVQARELWDRIMRATYAYAEPGVIFIDRINRRNNLWYCEQIAATNPCFTGDTLVWTDVGPVSFHELAAAGAGVPVVTARSDGGITSRTMRHPRLTRSQAEIVTLHFIGGATIRCTPDHEFFLDSGERIQAARLTPAHRLNSFHDSRVERVERTGERADVYCGTVEETGRFFIRAGHDVVLVSNCGEQPLPPYGNCLLGSLNLAAMVKEPFTKGAHIDTAELRRLTGTATRMLDNVIEVSRFPLPQQQEEAFAKRRIGLGVTGLADALIMCGLRYGAPAAVAAASNWLSEIQCAAYTASVQLAEEKGRFPLFDTAKYLAGETIQALPAGLRNAIEKHGIRNSHLLSIAPTGTISVLGGNVSSGIEPVFSLRPYTRKVLLPDGSREECEVVDYALALWRKLGRGWPTSPECFVDVEGLAPEDHLAMQAAVQPHVDAAISKTINLPEDIDFESFKGVYQKAYELDLKGCTTYRPNEVTGSVLKVKGEGAAVEPAAPAPTVEDDGVVRLTAPLAAPDELDARRYKVKWPDSDHALYVIISDVVETNAKGEQRRRPYEVFLVSNEAEGDEWRVALGRMISAVYRRGGDVAFIAGELRAIWDKKGGAWLAGKRVPSLPAAVGDVIERHMRATGFLEPAEQGVSRAEKEATFDRLDAPDSTAAAIAGRGRLRQCPKCGEAALIRIENCDQCTACDYSKC